VKAKVRGRGRGRPVRRAARRMPRKKMKEAKEESAKSSGGEGEAGTGSAADAKGSGPSPSKPSGDAEQASAGGGGGRARMRPAPMWRACRRLHRLKGAPRRAAAKSPTPRQRVPQARAGGRAQRNRRAGRDDHQRGRRAVNRPSFELKVGKEEFKKDRENGLLGIGVTRTMGLPIECMSAAISAGQGLRFGKDDGAVLKLGYDDDLEDAFSGSLDSIVYGMSVPTLNAVGMSAKLLDMRINKVFMSQTAGEIAESLAGEAGVQVERADSGISFPVYVIDDRSSCYEHLLMLARRCGYDVYVNDGGKLVFGKFEGKGKHRFEYGKGVLGARLVEELTAYEGVKAYGRAPRAARAATLTTGSPRTRCSGRQEGRGC
jgi:hypothetical protein